MIPGSIQFTGLDLGSGELLVNREVRGPFLPSWSRVLIDIDTIEILNLYRKWTIQNTYGRFGLVVADPKTAIYFEDHKDAILFKLMDAEEAIRSKEFT